MTSRDVNGKIDPDSFSVLLKFSSRKSVEQHILESYFVDVNEEYVPLAIQYLKIQLQNPPNFDARLTYRKETEGIKKKSETEKGKCRIRKQTEIEKKNLENVKQQKILTFREMVFNAKYSFYVVCHRFLYKKSVKKFVSTNHNVSCNEFHEIESFDQCKYVCITCDKHL